MSEDKTGDSASDACPMIEILTGSGKISALSGWHCDTDTEGQPLGSRIPEAAAKVMRAEPTGNPVHGVLSTLYDAEPFFTEKFSRVFIDASTYYPVPLTGNGGSKGLSYLNERILVSKNQLCHDHREEIARVWARTTQYMVEQGHAPGLNPLCCGAIGDVDPSEDLPAFWTHAVWSYQANSQRLSDEESENIQNDIVNNTKKEDEQFWTISYNDLSAGPFEKSQCALKKENRKWNVNDLVQNLKERTEKYHAVLNAALNKSSKQLEVGEIELSENSVFVTIPVSLGLRRPTNQLPGAVLSGLWVMLEPKEREVVKEADVKEVVRALYFMLYTQYEKQLHDYISYMSEQKTEMRNKGGELYSYLVSLCAKIYTQYAWPLERGRHPTTNEEIPDDVQQDFEIYNWREDSTGRNPIDDFGKMFKIEGGNPTIGCLRQFLYHLVRPYYSDVFDFHFEIDDHCEIQLPLTPGVLFLARLARFVHTYRENASGNRSPENPEHGGICLRIDNNRWMILSIYIAEPTKFHTRLMRGEAGDVSESLEDLLTGKRCKFFTHVSIDEEINDKKSIKTVCDTAYSENGSSFKGLETEICNERLELKWDPMIRC